MGPYLKPNPDVPHSNVLSRMTAREIEDLSYKFSVRNFWHDKGVRKYNLTKTTRERLCDLREGKLPKGWYYEYSAHEIKTRMGRDEDGPVNKHGDVIKPGEKPEEDYKPQPKRPKWPDEETAVAGTFSDHKKMPPVNAYDQAGVVSDAIIQQINQKEAIISEHRIRAIVQEEFGTIKDKLNDTLSKFNKKITEGLPPTKVVLVDPDNDNKETVVEGQHEAFGLVVRYVKARQNVLMVGPAGSGKTRLAAEVAKHLGLRFGMISCSVGMSEGQLTGRLLPFGESGRFVYVQSQFVDFYKNGGLFLIDELDASDANTMMVLQAALANTFMPVPNDPDNPIAQRHKDFVCLGAANTYLGGGNRTFVGRNQMDAATADRFVSARVEVGYDPKLERSAVDGEVLDWGLKVREAIEKYQLRRFLSTRALLRFTEQKEHGLTMKEFKTSYFLDWADDDKRKVESLHKAVTK